VLALVEPIKNFHSQNQEIKSGDFFNCVRRNGSETARHFRQPLPEDNRGFRCNLILPTATAIIAEAAQSRAGVFKSFKSTHRAPPQTACRLGQTILPVFHICLQTIVSFRRQPNHPAINARLGSTRRKSLRGSSNGLSSMRQSLPRQTTNHRRMASRWTRPIESCH
jgi:hypothetical protein